MPLEQMLRHIVAQYGVKILDKPQVCKKKLRKAGFDTSTLAAELFFLLLDKNAASETRLLIQQNRNLTKYAIATEVYAKLFALENMSNERQTIFLEHIQLLIEILDTEGITASWHSPRTYKKNEFARDFETALEKLIHDYGISALTSPARARSLLNDLAGNAFKEESLEFESFLVRLNGNGITFPHTANETFLVLLRQTLARQNLSYYLLERAAAQYALWQEEKRNDPTAPTQEKNAERNGTNADDEENTYEYGDDIRWLLEAAKQGEADAQFRLGVMRYYGEDTTQNYEEAAYWFQKAAEQGDAAAQYNLGLMYYKGEGVAKDYGEAMMWHRLAAKQGNANAQNNLGNMYYNGDGVAKDYGEAAMWYRLAAKQGNAGAQLNLGGMYYKGEGVAQDHREAAVWCRLAAKQGNANAQNNLGSMYYKGEGVAQDYGEAAMWFRLAAKQGDADAQNNLGSMYYNGDGVTQDYGEAMMWYRLAAKQGDACAQFRLGGMYYKGEGVAQDHREAAVWCRLAAKQGNVHAQYNLGLMYEYGDGVAQDYEEAARWYREAASQGYEKAQSALESLATKSFDTPTLKPEEDMNDLPSERVVCKRSSRIIRHRGSAYYCFFDSDEDFLFYAKKGGNQTLNVPPVNVPIEVEILERDANDRVTQWEWNYIDEPSEASSFDNTTERKPAITNQEIVERFLRENRHEYCDDCLSHLAEVHPRQQVYQICERSAVIAKNTYGTCYYCGRYKTTRYSKV